MRRLSENPKLRRRANVLRGQFRSRTTESPPAPSRRRVSRVLWTAMVRFYQDDGFGRAAEMAYNALFSVFPTMLLLIALVRRFGPAETPSLLLRLAADFLPPPTVRFLEQNLHRLLAEPPPVFLPAGFLLLLWVASNYLNALMKGLSRTVPDAHVRPFLARRLIAIGLVLLFGLGSVLSVSALILGSRMVQALYERLGPLAPLLTWTRWLRLPFGLAVMTLLAAFLYWIVPRRRPRWQQTLPGAVTFALTWMGTTTALSAIVTHYATMGRLYGAITGVILTLIWFYLTSLLLFLGAEVNAAWNELPNRTGPQPPARAVRKGSRRWAKRS